MKLATRLRLLIALALLPPLAVQTWTGLQQWRRRDAELQAEAVAYSRALQADLVRTAEGVRQLLVALAEIPAIRNADVQACTTYLQAVARQFPSYALLAVNDADGSILCNSGGAAPGAYSNAARAYHQRAMTSGGFAAGDLVTGVATGRRSLHFALPFRRPTGELGGIVLASLDQTRLAAQLAAAALPSGALAVLLDPSGTVAAGVEDGRPVLNDWVGRPAPAVLRAALQVPAPIAVVAAGPDGVARLFGAVPPDPALGGIVVAAGLDQDRALADLRQLTESTVLALSFGAVLALGAGTLGARRFVLVPLARLMAAADRVGGGDLAARSDLGRHAGSMRDLGAAFDRMAAALAEREGDRGRALAALGEAEDDLRHTVALNPQIVRVVTTPSGDTPRP
ncbi:PDC sensor domain-containing protein [Paracraurococcus lichenis]|uniref:HAMP domain-containing protein n=1 Tax=Paracraurococcus lichenis TaxID=3064888 RepID=A0ABT9E9G4_9PROT|nr:HAMP domain-containing protein [Paracraurococcus sp. LOR1-02]MDO9712739.1 HAMP domain-containing protein [Paracraurococcus sp. LOR1-02]